MLTFLSVGFILVCITMFIAFYISGLAVGCANLGIRTIEKIFKEKLL